MSNSKLSILSRLHKNRQPQTEAVEAYQPEYGWTKQQKIEKFSDCMVAVHSEVVTLKDGNWLDWINKELPKRELKNILVGNNEVGQLAKTGASELLNVQNYDKSIEQWKDDLFKHVDVGITGTRGGIAETGSLIVWPDATEPRLMSLVPPVHIALLEADNIYENFAQAMRLQNWSHNMPTNALLISGPSKTADIEQTLAYGIHGPQQLIVLILN